MPRTWEFKIAHVTVMPRKNYPGDFDETFIDKQKLQLAITYASQMAGKAFLKIKELKNGSLKGDDALEVQYALAKYFSIHSSDGGFTHYIDGIARVYYNIILGLRAPYDLVVFDPTDRNKFSSAVGYVRPTRSTVRQGRQTASVSPIQRLLAIPDEWNHLEWNKPWSGYEDVGRIHISLGVLFPGEPPADAVARTIVHEASHKFAKTTDVLYKHQSFAKGGGLSDDTGFVQGTMNVGGKTITPMAGASKGEMISPDRYVENADSYAWAARRLWKRFR
jgi:hypothetical protein